MGRARMEGRQGRYGRGRDGVRRDGKRSACRVLFSGIGKAGERQARTAARDAEYARGGKRGGSWLSSIPEVSMLGYYVIASAFFYGQSEMTLGLCVCVVMS